MLFRRREQHGLEIYWSLREWQCNATQRHCTATTYFISSRCNVSLLPPPHISKSSPANSFAPRVQTHCSFSIIQGGSSCVRSKRLLHLAIHAQQITVPLLAKPLSRFNSTTTLAIPPSI